MSFEASLKGKKVIVTGASKGIGRALVAKLSSYGAIVTGIANDGGGLASLKGDCPGVQTVEVDLADWNATRSAVEGIGPVDILVNNAALLFGDGFFNITPEIVDKTMDVNLKAVINVSQVVAKGMVDSGTGGNIVNISTVAALRAYPNASVHSISKAALDMLTKLMAVELGPKGIRVNSVNLGSVMTDMLTTWIEDLITFTGKSMEQVQSSFLERVPMQKSLVDMDDALNTILFAMSDLSAITSGTKFVVDGGFCAT
ncbi:unnamed protein product [Allacma fusca]|uniref:Uncharacterized protein n=1 Tax=Allacma fusca TaxID=39272 RepID=A0A8J2PNV6_9HEXA|nr:unnamed protein product [Allacma fusca]